MKFSFTTILIIFASAVVPAFAAPVPTDNLEDVLERDDLDMFEDLEARAISATAQAMVTWIGDKKHADTVNAKPICFYSGYTMVLNKKLKPPKEVKITAHGKLATFMSARGCNSIDNVVTSAGHSKDASKWNDADWAAVSKALAENLNRSTFVLLGMTVPVSSVWVQQEKPALMRNAKVNTIELWIIDSKGNLVKESNLKG